MARTTFARLTAVPGQSSLVPVNVQSAYEPGVYRVDNGRTRFALVKSRGAALVFVSEATAIAEAKLLMDDASQDIDAALAVSAPAQAPTVPDYGDSPDTDLVTFGADPVVTLGTALIAVAVVAVAAASGLTPEGTPDTRFARGILIRDAEDFTVTAESVYVDRTPSSVKLGVHEDVSGEQYALMIPERVLVGCSFTRDDNRRPIALRGNTAVPHQNRDTLNGLDAASFAGRVVLEGAFSSGRYRATGASAQEIRDGAPAWAWHRDDCVVGLRFSLPEVAGYRAGGTVVHSHDGSTMLQYRAYVLVEGRALFSAPVKVGKHTRNLRGKIDAAGQQVNGLVEAAKSLATALDAAKLIDAESAAVLVATKVLDVDADKLTESIERLHNVAADYSPSLGGIRYVLAAAYVRESTQPESFSAWYFGVASERVAKALAVLATEAARRKADTEVSLIEEVKRIEARLPKLEGDGGAAERTRRWAILSALRATSLFPRDSAAEVDAFGDRAEGTAHKVTPTRLLALRAVFGTMSTDARALDAEWWTAPKVRDNALQIMLEAASALFAQEGGAS